MPTKRQALANLRIFAKSDPLREFQIHPQPASAWAPNGFRRCGPLGHCSQLATRNSELGTRKFFLLTLPFGGDSRLLSKPMFTIGQFSKITGFSVKTIRLYHEKGLLKPVEVDRDTNYRYFGDHNVERARAIAHLRDMQFSLAEIKEILEAFTSESDLVPFLLRQREAIEKRMSELKRVADSIDSFLRTENEYRSMTARSSHQVTRKSVEDVQIASIRWCGRYADTGRVLTRVAKRVGRHIRGGPFNLYHTMEYREDGSDIESCFPVADCPESEEVRVRVLPGGPCLSLIHVGSYTELGRSYARLFEYVQSNGLAVDGPVREHYLKGPNPIFGRNPRKFLTEIQIMLSKPMEEKHDKAE